MSALRLLAPCQPR